MNSTALEQSVCRICSDQARGVHYGVITCEGCKGFFKRVNSMANPPTYRCYFGRNCPLTPETRNNCKACRLQRCIELGMMLRLSKKTKSNLQNMEHGSSCSPTDLHDALTVDDGPDRNVSSLETDQAIAAALKASGLDGLNALQSTPCGLTLIRKVLTGNTKSSPDALKNVIRGHVKDLSSNNTDTQVTENGDMKRNMRSGERSDCEQQVGFPVVDVGSSSPSSHSSTTSGNVAQRSTHSEHNNNTPITQSTDLALPPMPPLILGMDLEYLPPPPPLLHVPRDDFGIVNADHIVPPGKVLYFGHFVDAVNVWPYYNRRSIHNVDDNKYGQVYPYKVRPDVQLKKRKRGRPRKVRPSIDDWYSDLCESHHISEPSRSNASAMYCMNNGSFFQPDTQKLGSINYSHAY